MKHVYPVRHPASLDAQPKGSTTASRDQAREPSLPHEQDESSASQASATPQHREVGKQAYDNATDGTAAYIRTKDTEMNTVRGGINYHFNSTYEPLK